MSSSSLEKQINVDPYHSFAEHQPFLPNIKCETGEPDFINPNGYHNIIQVIQAIGIRAGIKQYGNGAREWLLVECDGLPYNLIREIIAHVWRCAQCQKCFYGLTVFEEHKCFILHKISPVLEFDWLVPVCGLLHLEMNLARSYTKLNWEVFFRILGITLGFKSPKAQEYLHKGADHHKLWHMLEILYTALSLELIVPYVKECISSTKRASCDGYWEWCSDIEDPNYLYIQNSVFTHLHALMMLRSGNHN